MRIYDRTNIGGLFLSPYVHASIFKSGLLLEHRMTAETLFLTPRENSLRDLWTGVQSGGDENFWRTLLGGTAQGGEITLEYMIRKGYLE